MMTKLILLFTIVLSECVFSVLTAGTATITHISPTKGSSNGGTRLTLFGTGFPSSQFNFGAGNANIGSYVQLVSKTHSYDCERHIDGCTSNKITCNTRAMPVVDDGYTLEVKIDGKTMAKTSICSADPSKCVFKTRNANTPTITRIEPTSGPPGTLITMYGNIVTDLYGSNLEPADQVRILRAYNLDKGCEMKNLSSDTQSFYGINKDDGYIKCLMGGSYVGPQNVSFIVANEYGRSKPDHTLLKYTASGRIAMFQSYAAVDSISPATGSTNGGTKLTITGNYFDNTTQPVQVQVAGQNCTVTSMTMTQIICITKAQPTSQSSYSGNRGLLKEEWKQTAGADAQTIQGLSTTASDYGSTTIDNSSFTFDNHNYASRLSGYFTPSITSDYRLHIRGDGPGWLYFSPTGPPSAKSQVASVTTATTSYWDHNGQVSQLYNLQKGTPYYMEVLHSGGIVSVAARANKSPVTASMSGSGRDEKQYVYINSTVVHEKQSPTFSNMVVLASGATASYTKEVQNVTITDISGNNQYVHYRLGLNGVYTAPILATADATAVQDALNDLASLHPETASVTKVATSVSTSKKFNITFDSERGNIDNLMVKVETSNTITVSVTEKTAGVASRSKAFIKMGGDTVSPGIPAGATATQVKEKLNTFFGVRCPQSTVSPSATGFHQDFEVSGTSEIEPLCGRFSGKNFPNVYKTAAKTLGYRLSDYKNLCFGYFGTVSQLKVIHDYKDATKRYTAYIDLNVLPSPADQWNYTCIDIGTPIIAKNPSQTFHRAWEIEILSDSKADYYLDEVAALKDADLISDIGVKFNQRRYLAAKPGGQPVKEITVTGTMPTVTVTLETYECANNFDLISMAPSQTTVSVTTNRNNNEKASPPVEGTILVGYDGKQATIRPTYEAEEIVSALEAAFPGTDGIGKVTVEKLGDCANLAFLITFITNRGDQEEMTIVSSNQLTGISPISRIQIKANGALFLDPIPGDMLSTAHPKAQVAVNVNGVPSKCTGTCDFEYLAAATPTLSSSAPSQGTQGTVLTLQGSKFSTVASENKVTIGGVDCPVNTQSLSTTSLTCNVGNGPMGEHDIILNVDGKGLATGTYKFEYTSDISALNNTSGSLGGGTLLTIIGSGFASNAVPKVDGKNCIVQSSAPGQIICLTPSSSSASAVSVTVVQNGNTVTTTTKFTYDQSKTPTISAISSATYSVFGGESITITGTGFGTTASRAALKLGDLTATIDSNSFSDTQVVATLPPGPPGDYGVHLTIGSNGYANPGNNVNPKIAYKLVVKDTYPTRGSLYGSTDVSIMGEGFGTNPSKISVKFGSYPCEIKSITDSKIVCKTSSTVRTHVITNDGSSPVHGKGFAWDNPTKTAEVGDRIRWLWSSPTTDYKYCVNETAGVTDRVSKPNGFSSGPQTTTGVYERTLLTQGTLSYWSGYVDTANTISLHGLINVQARPDTIQNLMLTTTQGYEANYDVSTRGSMTPTNNGQCPLNHSPISNCQSLTEESTKFWFKYQSCSTPRLDSISRTQAASTQSIDFIGEGFSSTACQNEVTLGDYSCTVSSSTSTKVTCKVDPQNQLQIGDVQKYDVRISNLGRPFFALPESSWQFVLLPHISNISPTEGSTEGGVTLTVSGGGFISQATTVTIGTYNCPVNGSNLDYRTITCTVPKLGKQENKEVKVIVSKNNQNVQAFCSTTTGLCAHLYKSTITPTVTTASPDTISGSASLTLTGDRFGSVKKDVTVQVGGVDCTVQTVSNTQITCDLPSAPTGTHTVSVLVANIGHAKSSATVTSQALLKNVNPTSGSIKGNTSITITGNGFNDTTEVTIDGNVCTNPITTLTTITCSTPAGTAGARSVQVVSNSVTYTSALNFTYDASKTPTVTNVQQPTGKAGDDITITGTSFTSDKSKIIVSIDGKICTVKTATSTSITCEVGSHTPGQFPVKVNIDPYGLADSTSTFTYTVTASGVSPNQGSLGGGQDITVTGTGFNPQTTEVTVSGTECPVDEASSSSTQLICKTPVSTATATTSCDVIVSDNGQTATLSGAYTYNAAMTGEITDVTPAYGTTTGGTSVTITGTGFGTIQGDITVSICGTPCAVQSVDSGTKVVCTTGSRSTSADCQVEVQVNSGGNAKQTSAAYSYYWTWSNTATWGGDPVPVAGDLPVITQGRTIILDQSTPVLKMLVVQGGKLIFEDKDLELQAEYILITDNGAIQVGTEEKPFQSKATITLHGNAKNAELPIYGAKVLGVRNGTLDLHGKHVPVTWTVLAATANSGSSTLTLKVPVTWKAGDEIVIATTGHRHSQKETETRTITAVSADGKNLTLDSALTYTHVAVTETHGGVDIDMRAEVGLLTRNVKVQGSNDLQWNDDIEACPDGFDTGEFVTQTCFQGRFGDEVGSDQFGATILFHSSERDKDIAIGRLSNIEVTYAGQAFRLGRYPIHFHLLGDVSKSYVKGCAIHNTFNRAINIHGTHNVLIEHNVAYNIMGGAFFLEDGIETGNIFEYNLLIFVIASTSLLNDDITPASFWVTNPNNTIRHNHAAGGTHFGFWYRMHEHPDGPSFDLNICPRNVPLGEFNNNTAHSFGWFGLWIFKEYTPRKDGSCSSTAEYDTAKFTGLTSWNNEKGAEWVDVGNIQFNDFIMVHNEKAGIEGKLIIEGLQFDEDKGPAIKNSIIVGRSDNMPAQPGWEDIKLCTIGGIVLPYGNGLIIVGVKLYNFDNCTCLTFAKIDGTCTFLCSGFAYHTKNVTCDGDKRVKFDHVHHADILDDGTLSGSSTANHIVPTAADQPPSCSNLSSDSAGVPASTCPTSVNFIRMSFNNVLPSTLKGSNITLTNSFGSQYGIFAFKRITHGNGWAVMMIAGQPYDLVFTSAPHVTNISYSVDFNGLYDTSIYVIIRHKLERRPDRFSFDGSSPGRNESLTPLDINNNKHGDWHFDNVTNKFSYLVAGKTSKKRATVSKSSSDRPMKIDVFKCYYANCVAPVDPNTIPPTCTRPTGPPDGPTPVSWSAIQWGKDSEGNVVNDGSGTYASGPQTNDSVKILQDTYVIGDTAIPSLWSLVLFGTLELDHGPVGSSYRDFTISVTYLYIRGGRLMGGCDENNPFLGNIDIILRGDHSTASFPSTDGPTVGKKVIGAFGGLDLHGKSVGKTWTYLASTVQAGATSITLTKPVEWKAGGEIVIAATGFQPKEAEHKTIQSISTDKKTITLTTALAYKHIAASATYAGGKTVQLRAEVGYLTRNIKIIGESYAAQEQQGEEFGGRVLVAATADASGNYYTGYARLSNVEFKRMGQFGWTESYDPRYAVSFMDIGDVSGASAVRPCYVKSCSFNRIYNSAIGIFQTNGLVVENNVIHDTVHKAIDITSTDVKLIGNFLSLNHGIATYNGRYQSQKKDYSASVYANTARKLVMQNNAITGFEGLGFRGPPEDKDSGTDPWIDNWFHSGLICTGTFSLDHGNPGYNLATRSIQYANNTFWKCYDAAIFYNSMFDIEITLNIFVDNGLGVFPMIYGAKALKHECVKNVISIHDNLFVGQSNSYDCSSDVYPSSDPNMQWSAHNGRSWRIGATGKVGASMGWCISGPNNSPDKPLFNSMSYNAICCKTVFEDNTFANFGTNCKGDRDFAISTPPKADDAIHPVFASRTTLDNVGAENSLYIHRPRLQTVNPSDCVDMTCDGHRKVVVTDTDGTLLGSGTKITAISEAEFEWGGERSYGVGNYRIPKNILTTADGTRIDVNVRAKYHGIIRDQSCVNKAISQAWYCTDYDYYQLVIESMDADTETRRLSPIALLSWGEQNGLYRDGYIDLINGPQDHGWCAGYTCQLRLSTFTAVVAAGRNSSVYLTSTSPKHMRYQLLSAPSTVAIRIQQFINTPYRIQVFCDNVYKMPINAQMVNEKEELSPTSNRPEASTGACGDNYMDYDRKELYVIVKGEHVVEYNVTAAVFLGFNVPSLTIDQFFGPNLVNNLAAMFNIPQNKIRIVNIQTSGSSSGRRKRSTGSTTYYIEISEPPCGLINCTSSTGSTLSYEDLQQFAVELINSYQAGNLSDALNITIINDLAVAEPLPAVTDPKWAFVVEAGSDYTTVLKVPHTIHLKEHPAPAAEGNPFSSQPKLHMLDLLGAQITKLGASTSPWKVTADLVSGSGSNSLAELIGTTNITFDNGWANFTDLGISHEGSGYVIKFTISYPEEAIFSVDSSPLTIPQRSLKAAVVTKSSSIQKNQGVSITLEMRDGTTDTKVTDINWKGHLWLVTASMANPSSFGYGGALTGTTVGTFDPSTGEVVLNDLRFDNSGVAVVKFMVASNPAGYQFELDVFMEVISADYSSIVEDTSKEMKLKADVDFDTLGHDEFGAAVINNVLLTNNPGIRAKDMALSRGSVVITTTITGNTTTVQQVIDNVCDSISTATTFTYNGQSYSLSSYMTINGATYYGVSCGETSDNEDQTKTALLVAIIICVVIIIALIAGILYWRLVIYPKTKTHRVRRASRLELEKDPRYIGRTGKSDYEDILWREDTFQSLREKSWIPEKVAPPMTTIFSPNNKKQAFTGHM